MENVERTALLFQMLCEKYDGANALGKKAAQKMFYFFERFGVDLNLRYGIHFYGPYSAKLDDQMYELECEGYISINTNGPTHIISCGKNHIPKRNVLSNEEKKSVEYVMQVFEHKSPSELEALSTMDYIANSILSSGASDERIIEKFKQIKGTKFEYSQIIQTLKELKQLKLIAS